MSISLIIEKQELFLVIEGIGIQRPYFGLSLVKQNNTKDKPHIIKPLVNDSINKTNSDTNQIKPQRNSGQDDKTCMTWSSNNW